MVDASDAGNREGLFAAAFEAEKGRAGGGVLPIDVGSAAWGTSWQARGRPQGCGRRGGRDRPARRSHPVPFIQSSPCPSASPASSYRLSHMSSSSYTLLQYSSDPWNARFEDPDRRLAFTVYVPC